MAAKKKPLDVRPAQLGEVRLTVESMALPPERSRRPDHRRGGGRGARAGAAAPHGSEGALMATTFAFAESRDGDLRKVAFEAVTAARQRGRRVGRRRGARAAAGRAGDRAPGPRSSAATVPTWSSWWSTRGSRGTTRRRSRRPRRSGCARAAIARRSSRPRPRAGTWRRASRRRSGVSLASDVTDFELQGDAVLARHPGVHRQGDRHPAARGLAGAGVAAARARSRPREQPRTRAGGAGEAGDRSRRRRACR